MEEEKKSLLDKLMAELDKKLEKESKKRCCCGEKRE